MNEGLSENRLAKDSELLQRNLIAKLGRDTIVYVPGVLVPGIITTLSIIIFTRLFDPTQYGIYAIVVSTLTLISLVISTWIKQAIIRYRACSLEMNQEDLFNRYLFFLTLSITIVVLMIS